MSRTYSLGTVFRMTPAGAITTLYCFKGQADGSSPTAPPIQGLMAASMALLAGDTANLPGPLI